MNNTTEKMIELADGSFVDHDTFVKGYQDIQKCYQTIRTHLDHLVQLKKEMDEQEKIISTTKDRGQKSEAEEKLRKLQTDDHECRALLKGPLNEEYDVLLDRFIPAPYQATDNSVRALCHIITEGAAGTIKEALVIYHQALHQLRIEGIKREDQAMLQRLATEREEMEKRVAKSTAEARRMYAQAAGYQAQAEQSRRDADASMTSAINSHLNRR